MRRFAAVAIAAGALLTTTAVAAPAEAKVPSGTHNWAYPNKGSLTGVQISGWYKPSTYKKKPTVLLHFEIKDTRKGRIACIQFKFSASNGSSEQYTYLNTHGVNTTAKGGQHSYYRSHLDIRECLGYYYKTKAGTKKFKVANVSKFRRYY